MNIAPQKPLAAATLSAESSAVQTDCTVPHRCRLCDAPLQRVFVDLGTSPLCESYLTQEQLAEPESFYPLKVYVCESCLLVQLPAHVSGEQIFSEYAYFSSFSDSYLVHARQNVNSLVERFRLDPASFVVEIASNDGYLLRNFVQHGIPCLGIEPAANVARVAQQQGVRTLVRFFGQAAAKHVVQKNRAADIVVANNVLAHVPDLHDFVGGIRLLLADEGVAVIEIQYLPRLIERNQFDTIYHEHYCYYTLGSLQRVMAAHGLIIFDAEEIPTHGGSIRIFARHAQSSSIEINPRVPSLIAYERASGLHDISGYGGFGEKVAEVKRNVLEFLINVRRAGKTVAGYGAPGKGNTLLNYCGIREDLLSYTVDRNPYKHGKFLPGSRIPIYAPEKINETQPDYVWILPWNLREEIAEQLAHIRQWGAKFVVPIPSLEVF